MSEPSAPFLGIVVNPMSGRDVRRVAARASTSTHHEKQQQVTRLVLAALENGVERVFLSQEPFRINERAVENLPQRHQVEILSFKLTHTARDTETMIDLMWEAGCRTFIVLGGDGTNRIVSRRYPDCALMPLSTGTNNVFPIMIEASLAGAAAGLIASGQLAKQTITTRCKRIHIRAIEGQTEIHDIALIDAVVLHNDSLGSLLPFQGDRLGTLLLTRAEPTSVGLSPIGGYLRPSGHQDDFGVLVQCGSPADCRVRVPISPGLWQDVLVQHHEAVAFGSELSLSGEGILAYDGDRTHNLANLTDCRMTVQRDGPWIIEPDRVLQCAAQENILTRTP
ncbi:MAG: NAD(+)/NADH kinase [Pseudomonadales bacterium]